METSFRKLWGGILILIIGGILLITSSCKTTPTKEKSIESKMKAETTKKASSREAIVSNICSDFSKSMAKCYAYGQENGNCDGATNSIKDILDKIKLTTQNPNEQAQKIQRLSQYCNFMCKKGINAKTSKEEIEKKLFSICKEKLLKK